MTFYSRNLGVPARRDLDDPQVLRGKQVSYQTGCTACHTPKHVTARLIAHLRLGPLEVDGRALAIAFWPDTRGVTHVPSHR